MKERGILFSGPMVRAILEGRKTQTRRIVKHEHIEDIDAFAPDSKVAGQWRIGVAGDFGKLADYGAIRCPYGVPGDRLWVRETHAQFSVGEGLDTPVPQCVAYRATCDEDGGFDYVNGRGEVMRLKVTKWTPGIHMPRWASRITLEVTSIRVERLHDITDEDAKHEGVEPLPFDRKVYPSKHAATVTEWSHRAAFQMLWESINGAESWRSNPFVWVVEFKRIEAQERAA